MSNEMVKAGDESREKVIESLVLRGDLSGLTPAQRAAHYHRVCDSLGLNPDSQPFAYLKLNGKEILYATRGATDQLAAIHRVNRKIIDGPKVVDISGTKVAFAVCEATHPNGRTETATATLPVVDPVNLYMKLETKAKRRATLSILGLGMLDEVEIDTIPGAQRVDVGVSQCEESAPALAAGPSAVDAWLTDLAAVGSVHELPAAYAAHAQALSGAGHDGRSDVRAWLRARGLCAAGDEVTAVVSTMPEAMLRALDVAHLLAGENPEPTPDVDALVLAARAWRRASADDHSRGKAWNILARSYGVAQGLAPRQAGPALRAASEEPEPPPTGTDGTPSREPGEDDGSAPEAFEAARSRGSEAARSRGGEARAQSTELRVVCDESSDPCVTSAAAWREHLATHRSPWAVRGAFHKRASAFAAEGVHAQRESDAIDRIIGLGEPDARGLLHSTPRRERRAA